MCVRLRETEREVCRYVSVCAFRGDRVRKAVCVSVRVYARGDVSVCAFGGDRMRKVCLGVCVRGSRDLSPPPSRPERQCVCAGEREKQRNSVCMRE